MALPDNPVTREEQYLSNIAGQGGELPTPVTREELYLAKIAGQDVETPEPITRAEQYLDYIAENGGGGGGSVDVVALSVAENGTYTAEEGTAYSPVVVDVPDPPLQSKSATPTEQTQVISPDNDKYGLSSVTVNPIPSSYIQPSGSVNIVENGTVDVTTYASAVVNVPTGGGGGAAPKAVNFRDYDGTIVNSYTAAEFAALSAMPDNPSHDGLTAQGWNWTLTDAKTYVASYGRLEIEQMYDTSDGKLHIKIKLEEGRLSPYLGIAVNGTADIDWGDNSTHDTITGSSVTTVINTLHNYAAPGEYDIAVGTTGSLGIVGHSSYGCQLLWKNSTSVSENRVYQSAITEVNIPNNVTSIGSGTFSGCFGLNAVTIPNNVTSIGTNAFYNCYSLANVTIPSSVTSISNSAFSNCSGLSAVTIPNDVTSIGVNAFYNCYSLANVTIPSSVTSIGNNAFSTCLGLSAVTIPNNVTSIGSGAFYGCSGLSAVTIPDEVTSIKSSAFYGCFGFGFIRFTSSTPPAVANSDAFQSIPTDCIIYVPTASLNTYKSTTNYPSASTYTYVGY